MSVVLVFCSASLLKTTSAKHLRNQSLSSIGAFLPNVFARHLLKFDATSNPWWVVKWALCFYTLARSVAFVSLTCECQAHLRMNHRSPRRFLGDMIGQLVNTRGALVMHFMSESCHCWVSSLKGPFKKLRATTPAARRGSRSEF